MSDETQWITTKEAVEISGYNVRHLRRLIRAMQIRGRKFGNVWQVDETSLKTYLSEAIHSGDRRWGPKVDNS